MSAIPTREITLQIVNMTETAETPDELHRVLHDISYAVGGMVSRLGDKRSSTLMDMTEAMGNAFINTSVEMGVKCNLEMTVGKVP